jgi:hypothetical protein
MKTAMKKRIGIVTVVMTAALFAMSQAARADVYWNNNNGVSPGGDRNWANAANWIGGLPSAPGAGNAIVKPWNTPASFPLVSTTGNTANDIYIDIGASLGVTGGDLSASTLVTGIWGNSGVVDVSGGRLNLSGYLNLGAGSYDGDVSISGGTITAPGLSINTLGGASMDISGSGSFVTDISNLGNINYWVGHNDITADGGAPGWTVNIDTVSQPGSVVLSAVMIPEPSTFALCGSAGGLCLLMYRRRN